MEAAEAEAILEVECGAPPLDGASVAEGGGVESRPSPLLLVTSILFFFFLIFRKGLESNVFRGELWHDADEDNA